MSDILLTPRIIRAIDFETTGKEDASENDIIEVGWCDLIEGQAGWHRHGGAQSFLVKPTRHIEVEAMAIHHLMDSHVSGGISREAALAHASTADHEILCYAAHAAKFEQAMWPECDKPFICTYKLALRLWPDSQRHSLQVLRYYLTLGIECNAALPAHRAGPDAYVTAALLRKALATGLSVADAIAWSAEPAILPRVTFGKHFGAKWSEMDDRFLYWVMTRDFNEDVLATVRHEMARREAEADSGEADSTTGEDGSPF